MMAFLAGFAAALIIAAVVAVVAILELAKGFRW